MFVTPWKPRFLVDLRPLVEGVLLLLGFRRTFFFFRSTTVLFCVFKKIGFLGILGTPPYSAYLEELQYSRLKWSRGRFNERKGSPFFATLVKRSSFDQKSPALLVSTADVGDKHRNRSTDSRTLQLITFIV